MSLAPPLMLAALLLSAGLSLAFGRRSRAFSFLVPVVFLLALPVLLFLRPDAPVSFGVGGWRFAFSDPARQLAAVTTLLGLAVVVPTSLSGNTDATRFNASAGLLTAAVWLVQWAGDLFTSAGMAMLFVAGWLWLAMLSLAPERRASLPRAGLWLAAPAASVALAGASLGLAGVGGIATAGALLLAGWLAGGAWPFGMWRKVADETPGPGGVLLLGSPVLVAAGLLLPLATGAGLDRLTLILATVPALVGLAVALRSAWARPMTLNSVGRGLSLALAGIVPLAAVWLGPDGLVSAARLAVFVPAVLLLAGPVGEPKRPRSLTLVALLFVLAALAALPFTVGFGVLAPLYGRWSGGTAFLLLLVTVTLFMAWIAAIGRLLLKERASPTEEDAGTAAMLAVGPVLASLGLIWFDVAALAETSWMAWLGLALSLVGGLLLPRLLAGRNDWRDSLHETLTLQPESGPLKTAGRAARSALAAAADAAALLEGDYGLVWLAAVLALLVIFG